MDGDTYKPGFEPSQTRDKSKADVPDNETDDMNELINEFNSVFVIQDESRTKLLEGVMERIYNINSPKFQMSLSVDLFLPSLMELLQTENSQKIFSLTLQTMYTLAYVSFPDLVQPLIDHGLIPIIISNIYQKPVCLVDIINLLKTIVMEGVDYAELIMRSISFDFLAELFKESHSISVAVEDSMSSFFLQICRSCFDEREFENFGNWFLDLLNSEIELLSNHSVDCFMKCIKKLGKIYGCRWHEYVENSNILPRLFSVIGKNLVNLPCFLDFLDLIISQSRNAFTIDFDVISFLIHSENNDVLFHTFTFLDNIIFEKSLQDYLMTDELIDSLVALIEVGIYKVKESALSLLLRMIEYAKGEQALIIGSHGFFPLIFNQFDLYPTLTQLRVATSIDTLLFFGFTRDSNLFIQQLEEGNCFSILDEILANPSIDSRVKTSLERSFEKYIKHEFKDYSNDEDEEHCCVCNESSESDFDDIMMKF